MSRTRFKVILYLDETEFSRAAAIYSAILMMNMPNMHLTIVRLKESNQSLLEIDEKCQNIWPTTSDVPQNALDVFLARSKDVQQQVLYSNPNIPDAVTALLAYVNKWAIDLIVMGAGEFSKIKEVIFGSLAYSLQNRSPIPVLLVKELSQDFLEGCNLTPTLTIVPKNQHGN
ncbi:Universal stress protein family protein [Desulfosporosinus hippei DSM 8344]|uniref:Universal stress protein family protein n=1 Tax=Desulfosporosinus hippei DSM 8344 TaxID=1121419 RepID=A0A1G8EHM3_9FIRM|nr:Universal stress protein family protein [Desulfosporosinus hippei DSM 8344]